MNPIDLSTLHASSDRGRGVLLKARLADVERGVHTLCRQYEESGQVDFDKLMSIGILLDSTGHGDVDRTLVIWFEERKTAVRLDIVCALLNGLWLRHDRGVGV